MEYFMGGITGAAIMLFLVIQTPGTLVHKANKLKDQCEITLPRNQHCVMQYVPASAEKTDDVR
jgi:hypothetical protein